MDILPALDIASGLALTHRNADGREEGAAGSTSLILMRLSGAEIMLKYWAISLRRFSGGAPKILAVLNGLVELKAGRISKLR